MLALILSALFVFLPAGEQTTAVQYHWAHSHIRGNGYELEHYQWHPGYTDTVMTTQVVLDSIATVEYTYGMESRARVRATSEFFDPSIWSEWSDIHFVAAPPTQPGKPVVLEIGD